MTLKTALYEQHLSLGGRMVDFGGWQMPLHYGSQIDEHHSVRKSAGMFDVSHMMIVDLAGERVREFMRLLLANDVGAEPRPGKAIYSCMLNEQGGVIDDLIVYDRADEGFRMVVNAATRDKDLAWIDRHARSFDVDVQARVDLAMIAAQGPEARERVMRVLGAEAPAGTETLRPFQAAWNDRLFVSRTGYTGEDGFEIILPEEEATGLWQRLHRGGLTPSGLGARDTLRLEAGMNLYGADMDENCTPLESGLAWTVAWDPADREFIGRAPLETQRSIGVTRKLKGLVLEARGVLRSGQRVECGASGEGVITSGSFSPTLGKAIALARMPSAAEGSCRVEIRGKMVDARIVKPPFVRNGKSCLQGSPTDE